MSRAHSRKDSIEGAPQAIGLPPFSESPDFFNDNEPEVIVDLREFIDVETFTSLESDGKTEVHVSSSREAAVSEFSTLSPSPRPQHSTIQKVADCSQPAPARVFPGVGDNYDDLPSWMIKRGQWDYLVSTAGGPLWENLLRVYMRQERRLEFTETVCNLLIIFPLLTTKIPVGRDIYDRGSSIQDQRVLPVRSQAVAG